jgi:hypothetical protein
VERIAEIFNRSDGVGILIRKIMNRAKDMAIDRIQKERESFFDQLLTAAENERIGIPAVAIGTFSRKTECLKLECVT